MSTYSTQLVYSQYALTTELMDTCSVCFTGVDMQSNTVYKLCEMHSAVEQLQRSRLAILKL